MPTPQPPFAQKDRNRASGFLSLISVLISYHSSHVSSLRHSAWPQGMRNRLGKGFTKGFRKGNSQKVQDQSQLITCHSSHVTHLMSRSHFIHHRSLISCLITTSLISCLITTSLISCLIITSLILSYCLYTLGWPHLTFAHDLCPLVTALYYWWPLPIPSAVTYAYPTASFYKEG